VTLTSELRDPNSTLSRFLREYFPNTRATATDFRIESASAATIYPKSPLGRHYSTVGTAFDWRLRFYLSAEPGRGLRPTANLDPRWSAFLASLDDVVRRVRPVGRRLGKVAEDLLNQYCVVLALAEQIWRADPAGLGQSPLFELEPRHSIAEILALARPEWIDDLRLLSWATYDKLADQLRQSAVLNPTFEGSVDVGGADADLILGDCLIEIKTTLNPRWDRDWLYQILGYVLLDYADRYQIRSIGIYLARQSVLICWPLDDVLTKLGDGRALPLDELRLRLKKAVRRTSPGQESASEAPSRIHQSTPAIPGRRTARGGSITRSGPTSFQLELPGFQVE
jgi:hypothetical protein